MLPLARILFDECAYPTIDGGEHEAVRDAELGDHELESKFRPAHRSQTSQS